MSVWFVSDTHCGHGNIIKYCKRPFLNPVEKEMLDRGEDFRVSYESIQRMDATIINNINSVVKRDDILYHLGDFCFADYNAARKYRDRINCQRIYLFWGNHDKKYIRDLFEDCYFQGGGGTGNQPPKLLIIEDLTLWCNHYPQLSWDKSFKGIMLHGHCHGNLRRNPIIRAAYDYLRILDVGVDGPDTDVDFHKFMPWSLSEIRQFMKSKNTSAFPPDQE